MKRKHAVQFFSLLLLLALGLNCEPLEYDEVSFIDVTTLGFDQDRLSSSFSETTISGSIKGLAIGDQLENHGHVWIKGNTDPLLENNLGSSSFGPKSGELIEFETQLTDLEPQEDYTYRSYAIFKGETIYGSAERISTTKEGFTLETQKVEGYTITTTGPRIEVVTLIKGLPEGVNIKEAGIAWGKDPEPNLEGGNVASAGGIISTSATRYVNTINGLSPGETYFIKPYLILGNKVIEGQQVIYTLNDIWVEQKDFAGGPLSGAMGFSADGKGHFIGGEELEYDENRYERHWAYDADEDSWAVIGNQDHIIQRTGAVVFEIGDTVYVGGGNYHSDFWTYHPASNTWSPMPSAPQKLRGSGWGFGLKGKGYVGGGFDQNQNGILNDFLEYDPQTGKWSELPPFTSESSDPNPRFSAAAFVVGNTAYLGPGIGTEPSDFWAFSNGQWEKLDPSPDHISRYYVALSINNKGYFFIGGLNFNPATFTNSVWEYDPLTDTWTKRRDFPGPGRLNGVGFVVNNRAYLGTGFEDRHLDDWWEYIPPD